MKKILLILCTISLFFGLTQLPIQAGSKNVIVIGMLGDLETLNPILSQNHNESQILNGIFSRLLRMNDKLQMEPDLLTKMPEISPDGLTYTFQLRRGVKFHDGVELTSADVRFLYDMQMAPGNAVPSREMWEKIAKFTIIDKYNFTIVLKKSNAPWLENWCYNGCAIPPKHILEKEFKENKNSLIKGGPFSRRPIGSVPYRLADWKTDQYVMLTKNPQYYIKGRPKIEKVIFKSIPDTNSLLAQFKNGDIDIYAGAQPVQYRELLMMKQKGAKIQVFKYPSFTYMHADFNLRHPALQDKAVRQAMCHAFPKAKFISMVLNDVATPADSNIVPMSWAYNPNVRKYDYNPAKAKKILDDAGWVTGAGGIRAKKGVKLEFKISTNAGNKTRERFNEIAKQEWEAVGAKVDIVNYEATTFFGDILEHMKFDVAVFAWLSGADPDCYSLWHSSQIPDKNGGQGQNYVGYSNPRIDALLETGQTELNTAKRKVIYAELQQILAEDVPYMFVYYYNEVDAVPASLKNYRPNPTQGSFTWNMGQWEW